MIKTPQTSTPEKTKPRQTARRVLRGLGFTAGVTTLAAMAPTALAHNRAHGSGHEIDRGAPITTQERQTERVMKSGDWFTVLNGRLITHNGGRQRTINYALANVKSIDPSLDYSLFSTEDTVGSLDPTSKLPKTNLMHYKTSMAMDLSNPEQPFLRVRFPRGVNGQPDFAHPQARINGHVEPLIDLETGKPAVIGAVIQPGKATR